jgi:predicted PurR-regulated permease PerM
VAHLDSASERTAFNVFLAVVGAAFAWFVVKPVLAPLVLAVLTAVIVQPAHRRVERLLGRGTIRAALTSTVLLTALVGVPAVKLGQLFLDQARTVLNELIGPGETHSRISAVVVQWAQWLTDVLHATVGGQIEVRDLSGELLRKLGGAVYEHVPDLFDKLGRLALGALLLYLVLFFLLYRGDRLLALAVEISPLGEGRSRRILRRLEVTVKGVFLGAMATALVQGMVGALGFWLTGFENYLVWAALVAVAGLVPVVGTALVWLPAAVYLGLNHQTGAAVAMLVIGLVVSTVDNLLRPLIIHGRAAVNPVLVFVAILGGLRSMGTMGLIYGPLLATCLTEVVRIYREELGPAVPAGEVAIGAEGEPAELAVAGGGLAGDPDPATSASQSP